MGAATTGNEAVTSRPGADTPVRPLACPQIHRAVEFWRAKAKVNRLRYERWERLADPETAIRYVFGSYATQALRVSECESHLHTTSQNGQYLGLFQMGSYARALYGHGRDALTQARAAYRYFVDSGRDWSPWSCKP